MSSVALPVGEELDALDQASWVPHNGTEVVGGVVVDEPEGYLDRLRVQEIASGRQRDPCHPAAGGRKRGRRSTCAFQIERLMSSSLTALVTWSIVFAFLTDARRRLSLVLAAVKRLRALGTVPSDEAR